VKSYVASAAAAAAILLTVCRPPRGGDPPGRGFNVLIVILDACRADKIGCYGFERDTTPRLDGLARDPDAVVYRRHYVQGTWTKPSVASLFTGQYVFQHKVLTDHQRGRGPGKRALFRTQILPASHETLAERFEQAGYFTFGVVKSQQLAREYGFDQGFDRYYLPNEVRGDASRVQQVLDLVRAPRRFLGYVHLTACHNPFPRDERHAGYMERYGFPYDEEARAAQGIDFGDIEIKFAIREKRVAFTPDDVHFLHLAYEAKLRQADETTLGPLLDGLRRAGRYDDTLILVSADHGEELLDHGGYHHGYALWEELAHVPLVVKYPKGRRPAAVPARVDSLTQSIDVLPSLLALAGLPADPSLPGRTALAGTFQPFAFSEIAGDGFALLQEEFKLVVEGGRARLYDLGRDPGETRDLAAREPGRVAAMREAALQLRLAVGEGVEAPSIETELSAEAQQALRSLGYIR
jgi:arylsulfatase A-like enzyme